MKTITFRIGVLALALLLTACPNTSSLRDADSRMNTAQAYLQKAKNAKQPTRNKWLLFAAEELLKEDRADKGLAVLKSISKPHLQEQQNNLYYSLLGQGLYRAEKDEQSIQQFLKVVSTEYLSLAQQQIFFDNYASALTRLKRHFESATQRMQHLQLTEDPLEREAVKEILWQSLMQISNPSIYQNSLNSSLVSGWLDLAIIAREYDKQPEKLIRSLEVWKGRYSTHPANTDLPLDMARAMSVQLYTPQKIAILLPSTGALAGSAEHIRRGILAAHYEYQNAESLELVFYDTGKDAINNLYQKAIDEGANFVIGPLQRSSVETLLESESFPVPVLSINRLTQDLEFPPENFYQFGLPVEDEATQVAERVAQEGFSNGLLLIPEGSQGERAIDAFSAAFEAQGGTIQKIVRYRGEQDYSKSVQSLVGVDKSMQRHSRLQQIAGVSLEFQARRRKDVDFVFFIADPTAGRRLKPFIDYYYAHDLALYSSSSVYQGVKESVLDTDLNKVKFPDIPLLLSDAQEIQVNKRKLLNVWPDSSTGIAARLFALGYDSYHIVPDLSKLRHFPNYQIAGYSGNLSVNEQGHVLRKLPWAQFSKGIAKPIPEPVQVATDQSQ